MIDIPEMTVLIVDDVASMCKAIEKMLKVIGYGQKYIFAFNGKEALDILQKEPKEPIDIILLDYNMPVMNGGETLIHIRGDRNLRDIPVIMITAEAYKDYVSEAGESVVDAYILKPLTIKLLGEKVSHVIEKANNPPPMIYHLKRARDFEDNDDIEASIREAELAMEAEPDSTRPIRDLGYYYFKNDDLKMAEKWLLKAADMNDMDVFAFHYLGELYLRLNNIEKAQDYFEKAMKISPRHLSRGIKFGKTLVQMKMTERAIQVFDGVIKLSGSTLELKEELADFCIKEGINKYATKLLESILREKPDRTDLFFKLGKSQEASGDVNKALQYFIKADYVDEGNDQIKIHLAKCYLNLKKPIWAEKALKQLLKVNPDHEEATALLNQCAQPA